MLSTRAHSSRSADPDARWTVYPCHERYYQDRLVGAVLSAGGADASSRSSSVAGDHDGRRHPGTLRDPREKPASVSSAARLPGAMRCAPMEQVGRHSGGEGAESAGARLCSPRSRMPTR